MQTPKTRATTLEVPRRTSPATPRTARQLNKPSPDSESMSPNPASRTPKNRSPKVTERRSPRSPVPEKKRPSRISELESQIAQLHEELKKAKDELSSTESCKRQAHQETEETKKQLAAMSAKLEESQKQLLELSTSEDARVEELSKISQDRDWAWQSELDAVRKQHSTDSATLAWAMNEIEKLKVQLEINIESEAASDERDGLRLELVETRSLVENLKTQLGESKDTEIRAKEVISNIQVQLEMAKTTEETLSSEGLKATEAYKSLALELEQSKARVNLLDGLVSKLQNDSGNSEVAEEKGESEEPNKLETELDRAKYEVGHLRSALEAAERRYQEEYVQSTLQIRSAYELADRVKSESCHREAVLEEKLKQAESDIEELKANLIAKETKIQNMSEEINVLSLKLEENHSNKGDRSALESELKKSEDCLDDLKASLLDKETELQSINEENEMLKMERKKVNDEAIALAEAAKASEREALMKLGYLTEEAEKSSRRAARVTEQLDAAQAANSELEAELRRLKVQSDQWRKAAEAAAAILSSGNNGKLVERTGSLDYHSIGGKKMGSPFLDDMDDESPKKKNGNMLKKLGVLLKKGQK